MSGSVPWLSSKTTLAPWRVMLEVRMGTPTIVAVVGPLAMLAWVTVQWLASCTVST